MVDIVVASSSRMILETNSSDTDSSTNSISRLGKCEVCNTNNAKYKCPKCEVRTCCLKCLNIHKKELSCDGIRDKTKYISLKSMTKMDFLCDYNFLEECTRYVEDRKRDRIKRFTRYDKNLPTTLLMLRNAASSRKITLKFLLQNFSKRNINTSYYDSNNKRIFWRIDFIFPNAQNLKCTDEHCNEEETLESLIDKYVNINTNFSDFQGKKNLEFYRSKGLKGVRILLKAEGIKKCNNRFYELDCEKSLKVNLAEKTIVEYPIIYIIFKETSDEFDIIDSDTDIKSETKIYHESLDELSKKMKNIHEFNREGKLNEELQQNLAELHIHKKRIDRRKYKEEMEKEPQNLLFADESMWNDMSSDSESDDTEEELKSSTQKKMKIEENKIT